MGDTWNTTTNILTDSYATVAVTTDKQNALYANQRRLIFAGTLLTVGVIGNFLALLILARKKTAKNSNYTLMLRFLSTNNLVGLLGMLITLLLQINLPKDVYRSHIKWNCAGMVIWRCFGLSSGCIAAVMAIERWMALARPFIYYKHITYAVVRKTINALILCAIVITFLPFVGFGAYMDTSDPEKPRCMRYRDAQGFWNKTYSILFMLFGILLCSVIVLCNFFVTRVLCFIGRSRPAKRVVHYYMANQDKSTRVEIDSNSGTSLYQSQPSYNSGTAAISTTSPDEIKFAKLMTVLSISFVICWMPQMIAIPLAIMPNRWPKSHPFFLVADVLMAFHFTSDPYVYVLSRTKSSNLSSCIKRWRWGLKRSHSDHSRYCASLEPHTTDCVILN